MATRVLGWFRKIRRISGSELIINQAERHLELTNETIRLLKKAVVSAIAGKFRERDRTVRTLVNASFEADELRRTMTEHIARLSVKPAERDDFFSLIDNLNRIIDRVREAGRILKLLPLADMGGQMHVACRGVSTHLVRCGEGLTKTIKALDESVEKVVHEANRVSRWEEIIDDDNQKIRKALLDLSNNYSAGSLILLNSFSTTVEEAADTMEDLSDVCRSIAFRHYT
ncbi:MAG: DUF47 domain-containing protein [Candidatus Ranarchaeia archaeon]